MTLRIIMKLKQLLKWFGLGKEEETKKPALMTPIKLKTKARKKWVCDKFGNIRQVVKVKCPKKVAKRITVLAKEIADLKEAS